MVSHASEGTGSWYLSRARRYVLAGIGPVTLAGTHFLISLSMLRLETPAAFGIFTFLFVAAQFTVALSAALFGAPLQTLPTSQDPNDRADAARSIVGTATMMAAVAGVAFVILSFVMGLWGRAALWYGLYSAAMILRWVGRAWAYADDRPTRPAISDVIYASVALGTFGLAILFVTDVPESACYAALALGAVTSLVAFGPGFWRMLVVRPSRRAWRIYMAIWHSQSRWALLGVVTTEAVANVHIYLVTIVAGAEAIAPLAAAALMFRPINVVQNALIEFERPQMARLAASGALPELARTKRLFLGVLIAIWAASSLFAVAVVEIAPGLVFSDAYDLGVIRLATLLWIVVTLLILAQVPLNVMLQAAGEFRALARVTVVSSMVSVTAVALVLSVAEPVWTIAAMAVGWSIDLLLVRRAAARCWRSLDSAAPARL